MVYSEVPYDQVSPIEKDDVHLWFVGQNNISSNDLDRYSTLLSENECSRAGRYYFFETEKDIYKASLDKQKIEGFYNCWTRKEAFLKAIGHGLSRDLNTFDVSLAPGEPAVLKRVGWAPKEVERWNLQSVTTYPGYAAAIAVEGHDWTLTCRHVTSEHLNNIYRGEN